ncbi:MAG: hypothetical protein ACP6IS_08740 [Candidatus Asgardarchaeia archaeon]
MLKFLAYENIPLRVIEELKIAFFTFFSYSSFISVTSFLSFPYLYEVLLSPNKIIKKINKVYHDSSAAKL